jgi:hypothetical protein
MAKQRSRKNKSAPKFKRKSRNIAAKARADAVLRQPVEMFSLPEAWLTLMGRNAAAFAGLQMRLARCRSPMDLWSEQMRYVKGRVDDTQALLKRIVS